MLCNLCRVGSVIYTLVTAMLTKMPNSFIFSIQIGSCRNYSCDEWRPSTRARGSDLATRDVNTIRNWQALSIRKYRHRAESCEFYVSLFILSSLIVCKQISPLQLLSYQKIKIKIYNFRYGFKLNSEFVKDLIELKK